MKNGKAEQEENRSFYGDVLKYSCGNVGVNLAFLLVMSYLPFFYTDVFGITPMEVAIMMLTVRLIDGFFNPLMGMLSDCTVGSMGRYRPWIIFGAPILGLAVSLLFFVPELSDAAKRLYVYATYIFYSLLYAMVTIPYHALPMVMSRDPQRRTVILTSKQGIAVAAQFIMAWALPLVDRMGQGARGWQIYATMVGVGITACFWISAWGGKKYDIGRKKRGNDCSIRNIFSLVDNASARKTFGRSRGFGAVQNRFRLKQSSEPFFQELKPFWGNRPMVILVVAEGSNVLASTAANVSNVYFFTYVRERQDLVSVTSNLMLWTGIAAILMMPFLIKRIGMQSLYWWGSFFTILSFAFLWKNPAVEESLLITVLGGIGFFSKFPGFLGWLLLPACADYAEWKFGARADGLFSSILTFIGSFGVAVGSFLTNALMNHSGYSANCVQSIQVSEMLVFLRFGLPVIGYAVSLTAMTFLRLDDRQYAQIQKELLQRQIRS